MTNDELFDDLKQFVAATVSQEAAGLRTELHAVEGRLNDRIDLLDEKLDQVQQAVADVVDDHEKRITRLEQQRA